MIVSTLAALKAALSGAAAGAVITLAPGSWGVVSLNGFHEPQVTLDMRSGAAGGPVVAGLALYNSSGMTVFGLDIADAAPGAVTITGDQNITLVSPRCERPQQFCILVNRSSDITISSPTVTGSQADGIDVWGSTHVLITNISVTGGQPSVGAHPDCVQVGSIPPPTYIPASYVTVDGGACSGATQGVDDFDKITPASDHIVFENLRIAVSTAWCIGLFNATDSVVRNNVCSTLPGARWPAQIIIKGGSGNVTGPNIVNGKTQP
jgi:hypothetical protein